jgi:hypothetical protein
VFIPVIVFFLLNLYVISSWECWWYASSFGQRPFVQSYGLMAVPLALLIHHCSSTRWYKWILGTPLVFCLLLYQFQQWQFAQGLLDPLRMTGKYYWKIFGRTTLRPGDGRFAEVDRTVLPSDEELRVRYTSKILAEENFEETRNKKLMCIPVDTFGYNSAHCGLMDREHEYGISFSAPFNSICSRDYMIIDMEADILVASSDSGKAVVAGFIMNSQRNKGYGHTDRTWPDASAHAGEWSHAKFRFITPYILHDADQVYTNIWNRDGGHVYVDNIKITAYILNENEP